MPNVPPVQVAGGEDDLCRLEFVKVEDAAAASVPHGLVLDNVGRPALPLGDPDVALGVLLGVALVDHVGEDVGGHLVLGGLLLPLGELSLERFDLLLLVLELDGNDISLLVLATDVCLASASLGAGL